MPPMQTLPVELISYIFTLATHNNPLQYFNFDSIRTPLVLSTVNRRWRNIALSTPALWTSLCISSDDIVHGDSPIGGLNATHIATYLKRSRNSPLDILIDARDPDWDFSESEVTPDLQDPLAPYTHPFPAQYMTHALTLLLPHLPRWRSISLLTDTWAPMYAALALLSTTPAPLPLRLESLTLMRCNEFAGYSSEFQPARLKEPSWLPFGAALAAAGSADANDINPPVLPKLRHLNLTGVHVNWAALPRLLPNHKSNSDVDAHAGLHTLELAYHSPSVRPSLAEFTDLIHTCPNLRELALTASGPLFPESPSISASAHNTYDTAPIPLPHLTSVKVGYTFTHDASKLLALIDGPNVSALALEDTAHPLSLDTGMGGQREDPDPDSDAGCLLRYLGGGVDESGGAGSHIDVDMDGAPSPKGRTTHTAPVKPSPPLCQPTPIEPTSPPIPFPSLERITLQRVRASTGMFASFWEGRAAARVRRVDIIGGLGACGPCEGAFRGLAPAAGAMAVGARGTGRGEAFVRAAVPCPKMERLCVRGINEGELGVVGAVVGARSHAGAARFGVDVYLDSERVVDEEGEVGDVVWVDGMEVRVFRARLEEDGMDLDVDVDVEYDGGVVFAEAAFDEYYAGVLTSHIDTPMQRVS